MSEQESILALSQAIEDVVLAIKLLNKEILDIKQRLDSYDIAAKESDG